MTNKIARPDESYGRPDVSPYLIHFTSGENDDAAFARLRKIIDVRRLLAGSGKIKGNFQCVCFTEAPLPSVRNGLVNRFGNSRYSQFGICVAKEWLFRRGGRPVFYGPSQEYHELPESLRWRHVRYELRDSFESVDFTWEREWRVQCNGLDIDEQSAYIVVPAGTWKDRLIQEHDRDQDYQVEHYAELFDDFEIAEGYRGNIKWKIVIL